MIRKLCKYTISVAVLATTIQVTPAFAAPATVTKDQIEATKSQIEDFEMKIEKLDDRITVAMVKSQELNDHIKKQQAKIKDTEAEIVKAKKDLEIHKEIYSERLKSLQAEGKDSLVTYAELLLSSDNFSEFLTRFTAISEILQSDTDLLNGLNEKEQALKNAEQKLSDELENLKQSQAELAAEQKEIKEAKKEVFKELANAKNKLQSQQNQLAQQEAERLAKIAQQREAQQREAQQRAEAAQQQQDRPQSSDNGSSNSSPSTPSTPSAPPVKVTGSASASAVIANAKKYLGVPYVWGGTSPSGFDCSGFVQYVFRSVGISLPRVSSAQQDVGQQIPLSQVQPGDLIFRGNPAHHVAIYIGGGQYIHAPQTGDVVRIAPFNPSKFTTATRVLR